jgi:hypothetical protein
MVAGRRDRGAMTSTTAPAPSTFVARRPEDLLAAAPILLGFEPEDSVILLTFGGRRPFHARTDLPAGEMLDRSVSETIADTLLEPARRLEVASVVVLCFSPDAAAADAVWRSLRRGCARAGIDVITGLRAHAGRYHELRRAGGRADEGVPYDGAGHPFRARAVLDGRVTHRTRAELVDSVRPDPVRQAATERLLADPPDERHDPPRPRPARARVRGLVASHAGAGTAPEDEAIAGLLRDLRLPAAREAARALVTRAAAEAHLRFWSDVVRRSPAPWLAAPAALLAWSAWQAGSGALAWAGVDLCREVAPDDELATAVADALERAVPPEEWRSVLPVPPEQPDGGR